MRNIYFISNLHDELYPQNTRSNFSTFIHPGCLRYIADGPIEAAVTAVSIDNSRKSLTTSETSECIGVRSNICQPIISSSNFDALLCWFDVETQHKNSIIHKSFKNPAFFPTTKQLLACANFEIIDLKTKKQPSFSTGSPTFIIVAVKKQTPRMKNPFNILLDSSCAVSKSYFPSNNNMEFTIQLPKRLEFQKDWIVALKSISFTSKFFNIYDFSVVTEDHLGNIRKFVLKDGYFDSLQDWLTDIYQELSGHLWLKKDEADKVIVYPMKKLKRVQFSDNMKRFLKLPSTYTSDYFSTNSRLESEGPLDMTVLIPQHFLVCCNMIEHSIVGGQQLQVLKLISNETQEKKKNKGNLFHYESYNNEFIKIGLKEFDKISLKIMSINGSTIKCDSNVATQLQLLFVNTNSQ